MAAQPASSDYWSHEFVDLLQGIGELFSNTEQSKPVGQSPYTGFVNYPTTLRFKSQPDDTQVSIAHGSPKNGTTNTSGTRPKQV